MGFFEPCVSTARGWNWFEANGFYAGEVGSCGEVFLSQYVNGLASNLTLKGISRCLNPKPQTLNPKP